MVERGIERTKGLLRILSAFCLLVFSSVALAAGEEQEAILDALNIQYIERMGVAMAEGEVVFRYGAMEVRADKVLMEPETGLVRAYSLPGSSVVLTGEGGTVVGDYLEYNIHDRSGYLTYPSAVAPSGVGATYIKAERVRIAPAEQARADQWLHGKYTASSAPDATVMRWESSKFTTCKLSEDQHYLLSSKRMVVVPGKWVISKTPRVYLGGAYLFTYPFDYVARANRRSRNFMPMLGYDSDKELGILSKGTLFWRNGHVDLGVGYWSTGFEWEGKIEQRLAEWISVYVGDKHVYDPDEEEIASRPFWGANMEYAGWTMKVNWSQREQLSVNKRAGRSDYDTTLWRDPEIQLVSPWVGLHIGSFSQYLRAKGGWGRFQETGTRVRTDWIEREAWGVEYYTEYAMKAGEWDIVPFFKGQFWDYNYNDSGDSEHRISIGTMGVRFSSGDFELGTAFQQRRVSGQSAFRRGWDDYDDSDSLYQRIGFRFAPNWTIQVQAIIDMSPDEKSRDLDELGYILTYDNNCCTRWIFTIKDDLSGDDDDWYALSFEITAFPGTAVRIGDKYLSNPFGRPLRLPVRKPRRVTQMEQEAEDIYELEEISVYSGPGTAGTPSMTENSFGANPFQAPGESYAEMLTVDIDSSEPLQPRYRVE